MLPLSAPPRDPAELFDLVRGNLATELLAAGVAHLKVFEQLRTPLSFDELRARLGLAERPARVLTTALRAFKLIDTDANGKFTLSELSRDHLLHGAEFDMSGYVGLVADSPGALGMLERLRSNKPMGAEPEKGGGAKFIFKDGMDSAMDHERGARELTLSLAGRARIVAPSFAEQARLENARVLLDVGGGSGLYSIACLRLYPSLKAIVWDRPEVLKIAAEMAAKYDVAGRLELRPGDMFADDAPNADVILLSNILHDWDVPECRTLVQKFAAKLPAGGRLLIHDVFLNDALDGPANLALYSAALFTITEGRAYSAAEYRGWLIEAGLTAGGVAPTLVHCGVLAGTKN